MSKRLRLYLVNIGRRTVMNPQATPPLGILYLASYLREKMDIEIQLINQRAEQCSVQEIVKHITDFKPDVVGFSCLTQASHLLAPAVEMTREALPGVYTIIGGPHASSVRESILQETQADAAVTGEGEISLEMLLRARFNDEGEISAIPGLIWRDSDGRIVTNPGTAPMIEDLDTLPFPAYDLLNREPYLTAMACTIIPGRIYASLFSSRGCPYQCNYCHNIFSKRYRTISAARVVEEIEYHIEKFGVHSFEFLDDAFNLDSKRVYEFCDLILKKGLKIDFAFPNGVRADVFVEDQIQALKDAGMIACTFALESGSPRIQKLMGKRLDIPKFLQSVEWAAKRGIFTQGYCMLGFPTETRAEMEQTIAVACSSRLHVASFFTVTPYPGTDLYNQVLRETPEKLAGLDYHSLSPNKVWVNVSAESDETLSQMQRVAHRRFYLNPGRAWRLFRDHPKRWELPRYAAKYFLRATTGFVGVDAFGESGNLDGADRG